MAITDTREARKIALDELESKECPHCGRPKDSRKSFCYRCFMWLPPHLKQALYKSFSDGYVEAYDQAKLYLQAESPVEKKQVPKQQEKKPPEVAGKDEVRCAGKMPGVGQCIYKPDHKGWPCRFK